MNGSAPPDGNTVSQPLAVGSVTVTFGRDRAGVGGHAADPSHRDLARRRYTRALTRLACIEYSRRRHRFEASGRDTGTRRAGVEELGQVRRAAIGPEPAADEKTPVGELANDPPVCWRAVVLARHELPAVGEGGVELAAARVRGERDREPLPAGEQ